MNLTRRTLLGTGAALIVTFATVAAVTDTAYAQTPTQQQPTQQQLEALVPDAQNLAGFVRVRPAAEAPVLSSRPAPRDEFIQDRVRFNVPPLGGKGTMSRIQRGLYSADGLYRLNLIVEICDSPAMAEEQLRLFRQKAAGGLERGTFAGATQIGDESWVLPSRGKSSFNHLLCRFGKMVLTVSGSLSMLAGEQGGREEFPPALVEAVAKIILLRAARHAAVTGVAAQSVTVVVNGKPLPAGAALLMAGTVYVPVAAFAKAAGMQSTWDVATGELRLRPAGQAAITLAAGSSSVRVGGTAREALKTPVLDDGREPVMTLEDLLWVVQGQVTGRTGTTWTIRA